MEIIIQSSPAETSAYAARLIARLIREKPSAVLGLATGSTPLSLYQELIRMHREEGLDFRGVTTFNLDEYVGLGPEHPGSYRYFMQENFFRHINVDPGRVHVPNGLARDVPAYCAQYEENIAAAGGLDVQILGIGTDGHIGFNEPSSSLASRTRIKTLTERTRSDNAVFFASPEEVPHHVITMGVGTIMEARHVLLLAFGEKKAQAIADTVEGPVSAMVPASILQMHPTATILLDDPAAAKLTRADYYRWVASRKPSWQRV
ncbi:MAG TPA: glucosamine-6-phosphate deaminase [Terrimicrobiaceae bacterium]|nr:glucosamine-6-phosphate deaminase [Terrimicrobiaceae bacterium]